MKYLYLFNEKLSDEQLIVSPEADFKIFRENGKLYFAFFGKRDWCKLPSAVEGVAMILDGTYSDMPEIVNIPLDKKDRKVQEFHIQDAIRWLWRAAKYDDTGGKDHPTDTIGGVKYYHDYKEESMLLSDGYFSRRYKDPIEAAVATAETVGDLMDVMRDVKNNIKKSFTTEKHQSRFDL